MAGTSQNRINASGAEASTEELFAELDHVTTGDTVAHRQGHERRLEVGTEAARGHLLRQLRTRLTPTRWTAKPLRTMLDHPHRQLRELFDLVNDGLPNRVALLLTKDVSTVAARRPVLHDVAHRAHRQQIPPATFVPGLPATTASRGALASLECFARRVRARGSRGVPRAAVQSTFQLGDPLVLTRNTSFKPADLLIHPQQNRHHNLAALLIDRLRLSALHTPVFDTAKSNPPNPLNAYEKPRVSGAFP